MVILSFNSCLAILSQTFPLFPILAPTPLQKCFVCSSIADFNCIFYTSTKSTISLTSSSLKSSYLPRNLSAAFSIVWGLFPGKYLAISLYVNSILSGDTPSQAYPPPSISWSVCRLPLSNFYALTSRLAFYVLQAVYYLPVECSKLVMVRLINELDYLFQV